MTAQDDNFEELELIADIEKSRARQHEGKAREAEAHERALKHAVAERAAMRDEATRRNRLGNFLTPRHDDAPLELLVVDTDDKGENR